MFYTRGTKETTDGFDLQQLVHIDGLMQDCSYSSALAMELLQSCTKPSMSCWLFSTNTK